MSRFLVSSGFPFLICIQGILYFSMNVGEAPLEIEIMGTGNIMAFVGLCELGRLVLDLDSAPRDLRRLLRDLGSAPRDLGSVVLDLDSAPRDLGLFLLDLYGSPLTVDMLIIETASSQLYRVMCSQVLA